MPVPRHMLHSETVHPLPGRPLRQALSQFCSTITRCSSASGIGLCDDKLGAFLVSLPGHNIDPAFSFVSFGLMAVALEYSSSQQAHSYRGGYASGNTEMSFCGTAKASIGVLRYSPRRIHSSLLLFLRRTSSEPGFSSCSLASVMTS